MLPFLSHLYWHFCRLEQDKSCLVVDEADRDTLVRYDKRLVTRRGEGTREQYGFFFSFTFLKFYALVSAVKAMAGEIHPSLKWQEAPPSTATVHATSPAGILPVSANGRRSLAKDISPGAAACDTDQYTAHWSFQMHKRHAACKPSKIHPTCWARICRHCDTNHACDGPPSKTCNDRVAPNEWPAIIA